MHLLNSVCLVVLCTASADLAAQNLVQKSRLQTRGLLAGCWGYSLPSGREFAIVGATTGTWIVETTDPTQPVERGFFGAQASTWREVTMYGSTVYSVSERHRGIRIIDLANPSVPVNQGKVLTSTISKSHTISVDPERGLLFVNGTGVGMLILDVKANPFSPRVVGRYRAAYAHDSHSRGGMTYLSSIQGGRLHILDTRNPGRIRELSRTFTPGFATHNAWTTDDAKLICTTDEDSVFGAVQIFDITDPAKPVRRGSYVLPTGETAHNVFVSGRTAYVAYYSAGLHVFDLGDPMRPIKVASFDTSSATSGFAGAWGAYPFNDSGIIYVSDIGSGLHVMEMTAGHLNRFGRGTAPAGQAIPRMRFDGAAPRVGASRLQMRLTGLSPNQPFAIALSARRAAPHRLLGVTVHVDLTNAVWVSGRAGSDGKLTMPVPVPNDAKLADQRVYMQIFASHPQAPSGFAASRGMWTGIAR